MTFDPGPYELPVSLRTAHKIHSASYDGIPITITKTSTKGGRKVSIKQIPNSDLQIVEDLGMKTRSFKLEGCVHARTNPQNDEILDYHSNRDRLLQTLESGGGKDLIHPWYGKIVNAHCIGWNIEETTNSVGDSPITLEIEIGSSDGLPLKGESVLGEVAEALKKVVDQAKFDVLANYDLKGTGNHPVFLTKLREVGDALSDASKLVAAQANKIDKYTKQLSDFQGSLTDLALAPGQMMDSINSLFDTMNGLYATAEATFQVYQDLFGFGDENSPILETTKSLVTRKTNDDLMTAAMQAQALAYAYLNSAQIDFGSVEDIEAQSDVLEIQYQKMIADDFLGEVIQDLLTSMRETTQGFFDDKKLTARQVIMIYTHPTTTRVLAYQYYGSSELGLELMTLNDLQDPYLIEGDVKVLTE